MADIQTGDFVLLGLVTFLGGIQLTLASIKVGNSRKKHGVKLPACTGPPEFERIYRAHQNSVEFFPIYFPVMWLAGLFVHQVPAALLGCVYLYSRHVYVNGYAKSVEGRLPGFWIGVRVLQALWALTGFGLLNCILEYYGGISLKEIALQMYRG